MNYQNPMAPAQLNQQQQMKFAAIDTDRSGRITIGEISRAYAQLKFPISSAKLLLNAVSDLPYIDMTSFAMFDNYVNSFWGAFSQVCMGQPIIMPPQVAQALQMLNFQIAPQNLQYLIKKYDTDGRGIDFGEFMGVCSYLLLCFKIMTRFDTTKQGRLNLDMAGLQMLGLWYL